MVDSVIGGYSTHDDAAYLAIVDYLGGKVDTIDYVFRGFGGNFCYSIMDSAFRRGPLLFFQLCIKFSCKSLYPRYFLF